VKKLENPFDLLKHPLDVMMQSEKKKKEEELKQA
jgi:hypothetical protein